MRESLRKSIEDGRSGFERYPKGSIVLCNACAKPIFKLDRSLHLGDKAGGSASAFKPLDAVDLAELAERQDIDEGVRVMLKNQSPEDRQNHVNALREMRAGEPMMCPLCKGTFPQVLSTEKHEVLDKAYTLELLVIPPMGWGKPAPVRGKRLGYDKDWVH